MNQYNFNRARVFGVKKVCLSFLFAKIDCCDCFLYYLLIIACKTHVFHMHTIICSSKYVVLTWLVYLRPHKYLSLKVNAISNINIKIDFLNVLLNRITEQCNLKYFSTIFVEILFHITRLYCNSVDFNILSRK